MKNKIYSIISWIPEIFSLLLFTINLILSILNRLLSFDKPGKNSANNYPIVIFEQWISKNYWHILMKRYLEQEGFKVYWTNYSLIKGGAEDGAMYLKDFVAKNKIKKFVLVGISMSALSSYVYVQRYGGWSKVKKFISIAGPFKGTPLAIVPDKILGIDDIHPDKKFLIKLINEKIKNPDKIISIVAEKDEIVPTSSSLLSKAKHKLVNVRGHNLLHMFSRDVFRIISEEAKKVS